jgi:proteasome lid subunit RPN8/RPN11
MKIEQSVIDEIIAQARKEAPDESCGYLLGKNDTDGDGVVT